MIYLVIIVSILIGPNTVNCMSYKSNNTDLAKCKVAYSRSGSTYKEFYPINVCKNESLILDFHFAVLASSDAHILLAETENVSKSDPAYEIVIGAGGNTFCDIRRMQKSDVRNSVRVKGLLSALDPHSFWLHITKNNSGGLIELGRESDNTSLISWLDPELLPLQFISFSTWSGIEAKWYFDCDRSESEEEIQKRLPTLEKLRRNLLKLYDPLVRPVTNQSTITNVSMSLHLEYLDLDEYKSIIEIGGFITMRWNDEKINWKPKDYNNITVMYVHRNEIWKPEITCYSATDNPTDILQGATVIINYEGEVLWKPLFHVRALCDGIELGDWPRDIHTCKLMFGFFMDYENIALNFNDSDSILLQHESSQWLIQEASVFDIESSNLTIEKSSFGLYFEVKRSSATYNAVFFIPFIVIATCLLLSFWIPPNRHMKISIGCAQIIMEIVILLALARFVPPNSGGAPFLIFLYCWCLAGSLISLTLSIVIINISTNSQSKPLPHVICDMLTKKYIKTVLWLPNIGMPEDYGDLDISLSSSNLSRTEEKSQHYWVLLAIAIDRVSFLMFLPIITIVIIKYIVSCS